MLSANNYRAQLLGLQVTTQIHNLHHKLGVRRRATKASDDHMNLKGTRVLIVEDDPFVAMAANIMVEELGGVVAGTAHSLDAAKEKIGQLELDCVMLDVNLNGDLSLGVAADLKARGIPFLFCTAYTHALHGFENVPRVTKPYNEHDLQRGFDAALLKRSRSTRH